MRRLLDTLSLLFGVFLLSSAALAAEVPHQAAIASPHPQASAAGRQIIEHGGNAFDAAVAVSAALAVVEPYGSGLGGGGFFLLRENTQPVRYRFIDAREKAPLNASASMYLRDGKPQPGLSINGPLAAAIPGLPAALVELAERYGSLPLADSLAPAIELARQGFEVDRVYRERAQARLAALRDDPESARLFLHNGEVPPLGQVLRQPELATSLQRLAQRGREGFYGGPTASALLEGVQAAGGIWQAQDLADY